MFVDYYYYYYYFSYFSYFSYSSSSTLIDAHLNHHSDLSPKQFANVVTRCKLQLTADFRYDPLLRGRLAEKLRIQNQPSIKFLPSSMHDDEFVRDFLVQEMVHFLSDDFIRLLFLASICDHAWRKKPSSWARFCLQHAQNLFDSLPFKRRETDDRRAVVFDSQLNLNSTKKANGGAKKTWNLLNDQLFSLLNERGRLHQVAFIECYEDLRFVLLCQRDSRVNHFATEIGERNRSID